MLCRLPFCHYGSVAVCYKGNVTGSIRYSEHHQSDDKAPVYNPHCEC
jgi:hypothetical protein